MVLLPPLRREREPLAELPCACACSCSCSHGPSWLCCARRFFFALPFLLRSALLAFTPDAPPAPPSDSELCPERRRSSDESDDDETAEESESESEPEDEPDDEDSSKARGLW